MSECIEWTGYRIKGGYGRIKRQGKNLLAHRIAYCEHNGVSLDEIRGLEVRHVCDNPPCVNPAHLVIGTHAENMKDMHERGRNPPTQREKNGRAKLTEEQVAEIRREHISGCRIYGAFALARKYGVDKRQIGRIVNGEQWPENSRHTEQKIIP